MSHVRIMRKYDECEFEIELEVPEEHMRTAHGNNAVDLVRKTAAELVDVAVDEYMQMRNAEIAEEQRLTRIHELQEHFEDLRDFERSAWSKEDERLEAELKELIDKGEQKHKYF